jgi:hypothetical protein
MPLFTFEVRDFFEEFEGSRGMVKRTIETLLFQ